MENEADEKTPKKRNIKDLPEAIAFIKGTPDDRSKFVLALEIDPNEKSKTYGKEFMVAQSIRIMVDDEEQMYHLSTLSVDHLRRICRIMSALNVGSSTKFECRKKLATQIEFGRKLLQHGLQPTSRASLLTSTVCRAVNVVFSDQFIEQFLTLNDKKTRRDHETNNINKEFWVRASDAHNSCFVANEQNEVVVVSITGNTEDYSDDEDGVVLMNNTPQPVTTAGDVFCTLVFPPGDPYLSPLQDDSEIDLFRNVSQFETIAFKNKIVNLFKIRRSMKTNMTASGTHDSDPWNFVEAAMKSVPGFTKVSVYYFYIRCNERNDADSHFCPFMHSDHLGDSVSLDNSLDESWSSSSRKKPKEENSALIQQLVIQGDGLLKQMAVASDIRLQEAEERKIEAKERRIEAEERRIEAKDRKKTKSFEARLAVAVALNDKDKLKQLMEEAEQNNEDK